MAKRRVIASGTALVIHSTRQRRKMAIALCPPTVSPSGVGMVTKKMKSAARTRKKTGLTALRSSISHIGLVSISTLTYIRSALMRLIRRTERALAAFYTQLPPYRGKPPRSFKPDPRFVKILYQRRLARSAVHEPPYLHRGRHHAYVPDPVKAYPALLNRLVQVLVDGDDYLRVQGLYTQGPAAGRPVDGKYRHYPHFRKAVYAHAGGAGGLKADYQVRGNRAVGEYPGGGAERV